MLGLSLVYSINLPQMTDLERYRPSTTTDLYDIHGQVFGSFADERRIVVPYSEFPPVLRAAIFSIEDKDFEHNGGINLVRVVGSRVPRRPYPRQGAGRVYAHHAAGAKPLSLIAEDIRPQTAGDFLSARDRAPLHQAADLHALCQPDLSRQRNLRI
jgi:hypothetical protein